LVRDEISHTVGNRDRNRLQRASDGLRRGGAALAGALGCAHARGRLDRENTDGECEQKSAHSHLLGESRQASAAKGEVNGRRWQGCNSTSGYRVRPGQEALS